MTKLDRSTTDRIGELTSDNQDLKELMEKHSKENEQGSNKENILKSELAKSGGESALLCCCLIVVI